MKVDLSAACRFFSAEDACRIALQAYYAAARAMEPPTGEPWMLDGLPYAGPDDFADHFAAQIAAQVGLLGLDALGAFTAGSSTWDLLRLASRIAPEKTAALLEKREQDNAFEAGDFLGAELNDLPDVQNASHNRQSTDGRP